jgi:hypothetical protein
MTDQLIQGAHGARSTLSGSPFPPIADYGFLSHCAVRRGDRPPFGRHLGNFPQAFSHLALINAVIHLIREDERDSAAAAPPPGWIRPPGPFLLARASSRRPGLNELAPLPWSDHLWQAT